MSKNVKIYFLFYFSLLDWGGGVLLSEFGYLNKFCRVGPNLRTMEQRRKRVQREYSFGKVSSLGFQKFLNQSYRRLAILKRMILVSKRSVCFRHFVVQF